MPAIRNGLIVLSAAAGALAAGQAPEFAQQYRQRLGGAIAEMQTVVAQFDVDAARNGMTRDEALTRYLTADDTFFRDRGQSMRRAIERHESLWQQAIRFGSMPPAARPLALARGMDETLARGVWEDFEPALPVTPHGLAWTAGGLGLGALLAGMLASLAGRVFRRGRRKIST